jgi:putative FmdB family regulatory protein
MPIFEFRCESCKRVFEELVFSSEEKPACPACKSEDTHRILSAVKWKGAGADGGGSPSPCTSCSPGPTGCKGCSK